MTLHTCRRAGAIDVLRAPQISPLTTLHFDSRRPLPLLADDLEHLGADAPIAFFTASATEVPLRWATCRRVINEMLGTPAAVTEAAAVALAVFEHFGEMLR
jgi:hypothetical protein